MNSDKHADMTSADIALPDTLPSQVHYSEDRIPGVVPDETKTPVIDDNVPPIDPFKGAAPTRKASLIALRELIQRSKTPSRPVDVLDKVTEDDMQRRSVARDPVPQQVAEIKWQHSTRPTVRYLQDPFQVQIPSSQPVPRRKSMKKLANPSKSGIHWQSGMALPPLCQAAVHAVRVATLQSPNVSSDAIIKISNQRRLADLMSPTLRSPSVVNSDVFDRSKKNVDILARAEWSEKMYILGASGGILQYASQGKFDRLPEKALQLGQDSVAFVSDAIPGRPFVLQISQISTEDGTVALDQPKGFFSRLTRKQSMHKTETRSFFLVFEGPEELESWLSTIRKEIELLGGRKCRRESIALSALFPIPQNNATPHLSAVDVDKDVSESRSVSVSDSGAELNELRASGHFSVSAGAQTVPSSRSSSPSPRKEGNYSNTSLVQKSDPSCEDALASLQINYSHSPSPNQFGAKCNYSMPRFSRRFSISQPKPNLASASVSAKSSIADLRSDNAGSTLSPPLSPLLSSPVTLTGESSPGSRSQRTSFRRSMEVTAAEALWSPGSSRPSSAGRGQNPNRRSCSRHHLSSPPPFPPPKTALPMIPGTASPRPTSSDSNASSTPTKLHSPSRPLSRQSTVDMRLRSQSPSISGARTPRYSRDIPAFPIGALDSALANHALQLQMHNRTFSQTSTSSSTRNAFRKPPPSPPPEHTLLSLPVSRSASTSTKSSSRLANQRKGLAESRARAGSSASQMSMRSVSGGRVRASAKVESMAGDVIENDKSTAVEIENESATAA